MPEALARFKKGLKVKISCYKEGCEKVRLPVTLGDRYNIYPSFLQSGHVGRLRWNPNTVAEGFELYHKLGGSGYCNCPNCHTLFGGVVVISNGVSRRPTIFGYDPEPA